jgi:APA family basic amino acid/polyamine antiporter
MKRPFRTPFVPIVPLLGAVICAGMIVAIDVRTLQFALIWMVLGLLVYFGYSRNKSKLHAPGSHLPKAKDFQ